MIRTRFAPSPTGYLHIGGVRTALFNWLFARRHGGQFILRIDDTDQDRNVDAALEPILNGFRWLGLDWDEGPQVGGPHAPYYQSERTDLHRSAADRLLADGSAYRDYSRTDEIQAEREAAREEGRSFVYSRRWMAETDEDAARFEAEGRQAAVRLKMPREGRCRFHDLIRGDVEFDWAREQDHVIQRADGSCLYHLASVVDDHEMGISHVIRAEEHLSNTPRQIFIAQSLGYELPQYAHLPVVAEPGSKTKLSKRKLNKYLKNPDFKKLSEHGRSIADRLGRPVDDETFNPVIVDFYEQVGYLPDAIINYLLLLGWSLDDKTEDFTRDQMIEQFTLDKVNKAPASFDPQKLQAFQQRYMDRVPPEDKAYMVDPFLREAGLLDDVYPCQIAAVLEPIVRAAGDRIKVAGDILDYTDLFVPDDQLTYDEKAFDKRVRKGNAAELLARFKERVTAVEPFEAGAIDAAMKQFVDDEQVKIGQIIHAVRVAVTGKAVGFGLFETLEILGRERCVARIELALARASATE
jgi:glutamyl-tRNA synthetase